MAWTAVLTWTTGQIVTAANLNEQIRDNMSETAPAKVTTAGDILVATGANALKRLAMGAANTIVAVNAGGTDLAYRSLSAGTGVSISGLQISIGQAVAVTDSPTFAGLTITKDDASASSVVYVASFSHSTSGAPAAGMGSGIYLGLEKSSGVIDPAGTLVAVWTSPTAGSNSADVYIEQMVSGALTEIVRWRAGNMGIAVTPEAWSSSYRALQIAGAGAFFADTGTGAGTGMRLVYNAYNDGAWKRIANNYASGISLFDGTISMLVTGTDAADSAISWITALVIENDGDLYAYQKLGVGMTPVRTLDVTGTFGTTGAATIAGLLTASANATVSGALGVGAAASATSSLYVAKSLSAGAGVTVDQVRIAGTGTKTADSGDLNGLYIGTAITVNNSVTCSLAAQLQIQGVAATVNGTLVTHAAIYLGVPTIGSTVRIIATGVAGCFLDTAGTWTDASHELMPDGATPWKVRRPERLAGLNPLALIRQMTVHAYDLTDAWHEEERDELVVDYFEDPETGDRVPVERLERRVHRWQVHEKDRYNRLGFFAEQLHAIHPALSRDGLGVNATAICAINTWAIQALVDENEQLKQRVATLESKVA